MKFDYFFKFFCQGYRFFFAFISREINIKNKTLRRNLFFLNFLIDFIKNRKKLKKFHFSPAKRG